MTLTWPMILEAMSSEGLSCWFITQQRDHMEERANDQTDSLQPCRMDINPFVGLAPSDLSPSHWVPPPSVTLKMKFITREARGSACKT